MAAALDTARRFRSVAGTTYRPEHEARYQRHLEVDHERFLNHHAGPIAEVDQPCLARQQRLDAGEERAGAQRCADRGEIAADRAQVLLRQDQRRSQAGPLPDGRPPQRMRCGHRGPAFEPDLTGDLQPNVVRRRDRSEPLPLAVQPVGADRAAAATPAVPLVPKIAGSLTVFTAASLTEAFTELGKAVEAAGDVNSLLLDKTGTITLGDRHATSFQPAPGIDAKELADVAQLASLADETPEGRSIVVLAKEKHQLRGRDLASTAHTFHKFTAQSRMSGVDIEGRKLRKGAADAIRAFVESEGGTERRTRYADVTPSFQNELLAFHAMVTEGVPPLTGVAGGAEDIVTAQLAVRRLRGNTAAGEACDTAGASATCAAMPEPMTPAPRTATRRIGWSMRGP